MNKTEDKDRAEEMAEERNAADGKPRKLSVEVTELPKVRRNNDGAVTSVIIQGKAMFKGNVTLHLQGDVASAYWSVTPGMKLVALAVETGDMEYEAVELNVVAA